MPKTYFVDTGTLLKCSGLYLCLENIFYWYHNTFYLCPKHIFLIPKHFVNCSGLLKIAEEAIHQWRKIETLLLQSIMINYDKPKQYFLTAIDGCARIPKRLRKKHHKQQQFHILFSNRNTLKSVSVKLTYRKKERKKNLTRIVFRGCTIFHTCWG
jgi:hypothetical protein